MRRRLAAPLAAVALVYAATWALLPAGGLWTVDNGNKYLQTQALLASGFRDFSLPWPGRGLDPELAFDPLPGPFSLVREGRLYSVFSPLFPALSVLPLRAFGDAGLCLLPLLATLAGLAGVGRLASLAELGAGERALAIGLAGLATPLWFYASVFWEHALAAALCTWAVALVLAALEQGGLRRLALGGLLLALAAGFREALLLFAPLLGGLVLLAGRGARVRAGAAFAGGLVAGLLPLALFQWLALGDPLGFHLTHGFTASGGDGQGLAHHLATRTQALYLLLLAAFESRGLSLALCGPLLLLLAVRPRLAGSAHRGVVVAAVCAALALTVLGLAAYLAAPSPIARLLTCSGFFAGAPLLAVGLVRRSEAGSDSDGDRTLSRLLALVLGYALLYASLTPLRNVAGIHWGNRYLLELYPLLAVPCAAALGGLWRGGRLARAAVALLVTAGIALQVFSIDLLRRRLVYGERLEQAIRERREPVIVTDLWWLPQTLARELYAKPVFYVPTHAKGRLLLERLAVRGVRSFAYVTARGDGTPSPRTRVIDDEGLGYFALRIEPRRLPPPQAFGAPAE